MNPYSVLQIEPECTDEQVKAAYHKLAKLYHPDRSGKDTSDKMSEITEAYNLIKTEELRKKYDREHQNNSDFTLWSKLFGECNICKNFHKKPVDRKFQKRGRNVIRTIRMTEESCSSQVISPSNMCESAYATTVLEREQAVSRNVRTATELARYARSNAGRTACMMSSLHANSATVVGWNRRKHARLATVQGLSKRMSR